MNIWVTRHGQTNLNKQKLMQGLTDEPLNERGIEQAKSVREAIGDVHFDAVYASPLDRAITTASIVADIPKDDVIIDDRIIEVDFGKYEQIPYAKLGLAMTAYWAWPEIMPAPKTVENIASMVERSSNFMRELETHDYENVLVACHGGIIRAICGYLEDTRSGVKWRPKPKNCEVRIYESVGGKHRFLRSLEAK